MARPKVIFFDAVGTLFGVKGSVGEIYSAIAREFGVTASAASLDQAFYQGFHSAPPMAFPGTLPSEIAKREYQWWETIALDTFSEVGVMEQFKDFSSFFATLYQYFATAQPWVIYPDVRPALEAWQRQGIEMGIISNFDSRLHSVLTALNLRDFFTSVTISTEFGAAKPDAKLFQAGLHKHLCKPQEAWHIGDSRQADYQGAKAAGLKAILIERST
jgi:putative hydrolase of the HAD superfamily